MGCPPQVVDASSPSTATKRSGGVPAVDRGLHAVVAVRMRRKLVCPTLDTAGVLDGFMCGRTAARQLVQSCEWLQLESPEQSTLHGADAVEVKVVAVVV
jgi:hypothetical protein